MHRRTRHSDPRDGAKTAEGRGRLCAIILVTVSVIQGPFFAPRAGHVSYGELKAFVKKGKIANPTIGKETIGGTLSADGPEGLLSNESVEELERLGGGNVQQNRAQSASLGVGETPRGSVGMERLIERCCGLDGRRDTVAACVRVPRPGGRRGAHATLPIKGAS